MMKITAFMPCQVIQREQEEGSGEKHSQMGGAVGALMPVEES